MADENGKAEALVTENLQESIGMNVPDGMNLPNRLPLRGGNLEQQENNKHVSRNKNRSLKK
jgi:hypothetical protein